LEGFVFIQYFWFWFIKNDNANRTLLKKTTEESPEIISISDLRSCSGGNSGGGSVSSGGGQ
jgi:hypothetical protein